MKRTPIRFALCWRPVVSGCCARPDAVRRSRWTRRSRADWPTASGSPSSGAGGGGDCREDSAGADTTCRLPVARRLHPHESRRRVRDRAARSAARQTSIPDVPDNYRARLDLQWPIYTGGRADALERAAMPEREARPGYRRRRAPICGSRSRARTGRWSPRAKASAWLRRSLDAHRRTRERPAQPLRAGPDPAQRRAHRRGAQLAAALLAIEARQPARRLPKPISRLIGARPANGRPCRGGADSRRSQTASKARRGAQAGAERRALAIARRRPRMRGRGRAARGRRSASAAATTTRGRIRASFRARTSGTTRGTCRERDLVALGRRRVTAPMRRGRRQRARPGARRRLRLGRSPSRCASAARDRLQPGGDRRRRRRRAQRHRSPPRGAERFAPASPPTPTSSTRSRAPSGRARSHARACERAAGRGAARTGGGRGVQGTVRDRRCDRSQTSDAPLRRVRRRRRRVVRRRRARSSASSAATAPASRRRSACSAACCGRRRHGHGRRHRRRARSGGA